MNGDAGALAELVRDWGTRYAISYAANLYHAERRDNGARVHEADPGQLRREVEADHRARPVIRPPTWQRAAWKQQVWADSTLKPGTVTTALALADLADDEGMAVPGIAHLAEVSGCSPSAADNRVAKLVVAGFVVRAGKVPVPGRGPRGTTMRRYQLVDPDASRDISARS